MADKEDTSHRWSMKFVNGRFSTGSAAMRSVRGRWNNTRRICAQEGRNTRRQPEINNLKLGEQESSGSRSTRVRSAPGAL